MRRAAFLENVRDGSKADIAAASHRVLISTDGHKARSSAADHDAGHGVPLLPKHVEERTDLGGLLAYDLSLVPTHPRRKAAASASAIQCPQRVESGNPDQ